MVPRIARADRLLATGLRSLGRPFAEACRDAVLAFRASGGGFRGRAGGADLWYTDFAIRALRLTGAPEAVFDDAARWLLLAPASQAQPARFNRLNLQRLLGRHGGGRPPLQDADDLDTGMPASTYALFLDAASRDLLGLRQRDDLRDRLMAARRDDGGFAERSDESAPQANATAAALAALTLAGRLDRQVRDAAASFFAAQQGDDGGIRAHPGIPMGDLLSTFTTAWALTACGRLDRLRLGDLGRFALRCRTADGGFAATPDDGATDPEYIHYGLGLMALLRLHADTGSGILGRLRRLLAMR